MFPGVFWGPGGFPEPVGTHWQNLSSNRAMRTCFVFFSEIHFLCNIFLCCCVTGTHMWSGGGWRRQAIAPPTHPPKIALPLGGERLSLTCPLSSHTPSSLQFRQVPSPGPINLVQNLFAGRGAYTIRHYEHKIKIATSASQYSCSLRRTLICVTLMLQSGLGHKIQHFKFRYKGIGPRASGSWGGKGPPAGPPGAPRPWTGPLGG